MGGRVMPRLYIVSQCRWAGDHGRCTTGRCPDQFTVAPTEDYPSPFILPTSDFYIQHVFKNFDDGPVRFFGVYADARLKPLRC